MPLELRHGLLPSHGRIGRFLWRWFRHGFQLASATGSVNWGLIFGIPPLAFQSARRFGRKLQTPFIGFGKGQGQLLILTPARVVQAGRDSGLTRPFANDKLEVRSGV